MTSKRGAGKVGERDTRKKTKTTSHASGGESVSEKTRTTIFFRSKVFTVRSSIQREKCIIRMELVTVQRPSASEDLLGGSSTSMHVPSSVSGKAELNAYMRVQQVSNDTDPLRW